MATIRIAWEDGSGDRLTVEYTGTSGISVLSVTSDDNTTGTPRTMNVQLTTTGANPATATLAVSQVLSAVTWEYVHLQSGKTATLSTVSDVTVTPDSGFDAMESVIVPRVTAAVDGNITAGNIRNGVQILGVTGTDADVTEAYDKILSRGEQMITNGSGLLGDNTNFSGYVFDPVETDGCSGSFRIAARAMLHADEYFPVDTEAGYRLSFSAKTLNALGDLYTFINFYDADRQQIHSYMHMYQTGTDTTLAQALNNGDTVVHLTDLGGWNTTTGSDTNKRGFIFWNYVNSFGYAYPPNTYSRNEWDNLYTDSAVNKSAGTITLTSPWSHGTIPAGTALSQSDSGSTYKYIGAVGGVVPSSWTRYTGTLNGTDYSGRNKAGMFPPAVAYAQFAALNLWNSASDTLWLCNVQFSQLGYVADIAGQSSELVARVGCNEGSTLNVDVNKSLIYIQTSSGGSLTMTGTLATGETCHVMVRNTGASAITIWPPYTSNWQCVDGKIVVPEGAIALIGIYAVRDTLSIIKKIRTLDWATLTAKSSVGGTEQIQISDAEYITPQQILALLSTATTTAAGLMSAQDKTDLATALTNADNAINDASLALTAAANAQQTADAAQTTATNAKTTATSAQQTAAAAQTAAANAQSTADEAWEMAEALDSTATIAYNRTQRDIGVNVKTNLMIATDRRVTCATISADTLMAITWGTLQAGQEVHVFILNSSTDTVTVTLPNDGTTYVSLSGDTLEIEEGGTGEVNITAVSVSPNKAYIRAL